MKTFGDKATFAFEVGERVSGDLRTVNIFIGGRNICCDDNKPYIPQFIGSIARSAEGLKTIDEYLKFERCFSGMTVEEAHEFVKSTRDENSENYDIEDDKIYLTHSFMDWGPTTDNVTSFLLPVENKFFLTYEFWRETHEPASEIGRIYSMEVLPREIIEAISITLLELR
jgi:hypothetical protein